ncbi:hypothetical protein [Buttiauxella sp.]|uniref:hypothetical protein n=1 Tax=Buttiauxella sp. TaxID=1972222 RepID=UPI003C748C42
MFQMADMMHDQVVHCIPEQFLANSALLISVKQELLIKNQVVTRDSLKMALVNKMKREPNAILADLYKQIIGYYS